MFPTKQDTSRREGSGKLLGRWSALGPAVIKHTLQEGLRDALLRGPKAFVLCNRKASYTDFWSVLGVARDQVRLERMERVSTHSVWRQL